MIAVSPKTSQPPVNQKYRAGKWWAKLTLRGRELTLKTLLGVVNIWRYIISPLTPPSCRFYPSCSNYAHEALKTHGVIKGLFLTVKRVARCHPFGSYGYDPVPESDKPIKDTNNEPQCR